MSWTHARRRRWIRPYRKHRATSSLSTSKSPDTHNATTAIHSPGSHISPQCTHPNPTCRLCPQWKTKSYALLLPADCTLGFLKLQIAIHTNVKPAHQKLIHKSIKPKLDDTLALHSLFTSHDRLMLIGNPEAELLHSAADDMLDVVDDLDDTTTSMDESEQLRADPEHRRKLDKYKASIEITFINPPRPGKRLLVLDLDYTLFDMKTASDDFTRLKRPFTHRFLAALYPHYELIIWCVHLLTHSHPHLHILQAGWLITSALYVYV